MKNILSIILVISFCFLSQTQVLHASNVACPAGQYWDQLECKSIYLDCLSMTGTVWQGNNSCVCDTGYTTLYFGYIAPNVHNHYFQFGCSPSPLNPVPNPVTYCDLHREYSFGVSSYIQQCTCPYGSHSVESRQQMVGVHRFTCVSGYIPQPTPLPQPVTYCELNREYSFAYTPYVKACICPYGSHSVSNTDTTIFGTYHFTCVSDYVPQPTPMPINCWDGSYVYGNTTCPQYKYCSGDGKKYPLSYSCYVAPTWQTCQDGSVIPTTSTCPYRTHCSYNQYWNGYSCADVYQPYYPTPYPVIEYQPSYDWEYTNDTYYYNDDTYFQNDFGWEY